MSRQEVNNTKHDVHDVNNLWRQQVKACLERLNAQDIEELSLRETRVLALKLHDLCEQFCKRKQS